jgi:uncharacterized membrane-anchored protein
MLVKLQAIKDSIHSLVIKNKEYIVDVNNLIEIEEHHVKDAISHGFNYFIEDIKESKEIITKKGKK